MWIDTAKSFAHVLAVEANYKVLFQWHLVPLSISHTILTHTSKFFLACQMDGPFWLYTVTRKLLCKDPYVALFQ